MKFDVKFTVEVSDLDGWLEQCLPDAVEDEITKTITAHISEMKDKGLLVEGSEITLIERCGGILERSGDAVGTS